MPKYEVYVYYKAMKHVVVDAPNAREAEWIGEFEADDKDEYDMFEIESTTVYDAE